MDAVPRLVCVKAWHPFGGTVWGGLGGAALASMGVGFEVSKAHDIPG